MFSRLCASLRVESWALSKPPLASLLHLARAPLIRCRSVYQSLVRVIVQVFSLAGERSSRRVSAGVWPMTALRGLAPAPGNTGHGAVIISSDKMAPLRCPVESTVTWCGKFFIRWWRMSECGLGRVGGMRDAPHKGQVEEVTNPKPVYRVDPLQLRQASAHQNYQMNHHPWVDLNNC